jgi:ubiquinone/menaquinone biosynthesis C-methylase UbiE
MSKKEYFDRYAHRWDKFQYQIDSGQLGALVKRFGIQEGDWILDVGTGTGILLPHLAESVGKEGKTFALDFSAEMLSVAKSKLTHRAISFINSPVEKIPLKDEMFDRLICFGSFPHFEDKPKALQEMSRVLKKGGKLFIAHLLSSQEIKKHHFETGGDIKNDTLPSRPVMKKMMIKAKFKGIKIIDRSSLYLAQGEKG